MAVLGGALLTLGVASASRGATQLAGPVVHEVTVPYVEPEPEPELAPDRTVQPVLIGRGSTFGQLASRYGLPGEDPPRS